MRSTRHILTIEVLRKITREPRLSRSANPAHDVPPQQTHRILGKYIYLLLSQLTLPGQPLYNHTPSSPTHCSITSSASPINEFTSLLQPNHANHRPQCATATLRRIAVAAKSTLNAQHLVNPTARSRALRSHPPLPIRPLPARNGGSAPASKPSLNHSRTSGNPSTSVLTSAKWTTDTALAITIQRSTEAPDGCLTEISNSAESSRDSQRLLAWNDGLPLEPF